MAVSTIGFATRDIDALAGLLRTALGIELWRLHSPMIGPWYSDVDLQRVMRERPRTPPAERQQGALR